MPFGVHAQYQAPTVQHVQATVAAGLDEAQAKWHDARHKLDSVDRDYYEAKANGILSTPLGRSIVVERHRLRSDVAGASKRIRDMESLSGLDASLSGVLQESAVRAGCFTRAVALGVSAGLVKISADLVARTFFAGSNAERRLGLMISRFEDGGYADLDRAIAKRSEGRHTQRSQASRIRTKKIKEQALYPVSLCIGSDDSRALQDEEMGLVQSRNTSHEL